MNREKEMPRDGEWTGNQPQEVGYYWVYAERGGKPIGFAVPVLLFRDELGAWMVVKDGKRARPDADWRWQGPIAPIGGQQTVVGRLRQLDREEVYGG